jgi:cell division initiation protein
MKLTAMEIHHKEFHRALRGYNEEEVDAFLDQVADEVDALTKEIHDLKEKFDEANERVRTYQQMEATLNNTLLQAQRSSEEIIAKAGVEADTMLRDAELKSKEIVHGALQKKQQVANELVRIKHAEEEFRARFKAQLESQLRDIGEISLPDDVSVMLDDTDGLIGSVDVRPSSPERFEPPAPPSAAVEAEPESEPVAESRSVFADEPIAQDIVEAPAQPPASGFVSSVALGEVESPELPSGPIELVEPGEFELPGFSAFGERERDTDIEEID